MTFATTVPRGKTGLSESRPALSAGERRSAEKHFGDVRVCRKKAYVMSAQSDWVLPLKLAIGQGECTIHLDTVQGA